jgi:hypothetical protein
MFSLAALHAYHAESDPVKRDDALVLRDPMQKPQRHRLLDGYSVAAAMRRREAGQPAKNVYFGPRGGRDLLVGVRPHPRCNLSVTGCGFCTIPHEHDHAGRAGEVVEHVVREFDGLLTRRPALTRRREAALDFGLESLAMLAKLGFAGFLAVGFVAATGLTSGMSLVNAIAVPLCAGFFLWSLVLISCVTSRRA